MVTLNSAGQLFSESEELLGFDSVLITDHTNAFL